MNQLKHIFGVSVNISNRVPLRGSTIARSAGTNGSDHKRSRDFLVATSDGDESSELKLSGRSYAKIIAHYGKEIEARNAATKFNGDAKTGGTNGGFFSKAPFQRLARVSSLVKIKNGRNNSGPSLSTKSSSRPPATPTKSDDNITTNRGSVDDTNFVNRVTERSEWLDNFTEAHKAKRSARNDTFPHDNGEAKNMAHPLVQRIAKSNSAGNASFNQFINVNNRQISSVKKIPDTPRIDTNVSVIVKPLKKSDKDKNDLSMVDSEDNNTMLVTLTEESKSSSTSKSSPLRHIDLRINGKPAAGVSTVISKLEKLDVVSSAEKIEIRIPVLSDATVGDKLRAPNSTINVYISSQGKEASASRESIGKVSQSGDSGSGGSRTGLAHPSTFFTSKIQNVRKNDASSDHSKSVPWWTTVESFRRSEMIPGSVEKTTNAKNLKMKTSGVGGTAARGNQEVNAAKAKEIAVTNGQMRVKPVVTKPSSPRQRSNGRRKGTSAIWKIIENELQKKSEQQQEEQKTRDQVPLGGSKSDAKPEAKPDTKVKSTASNEPKKEAPSVAIGSTMPGKSIQAGTPTPDKLSKKIPSSLGSTVAASGEESKTEFKSSKGKDTRTNDNLSIVNDSKGRIDAKPISEIGEGKTNADARGRTTSTGQVSNDLGSVRVGSKIGTKPLREVSSKSETNEATRLPRTYGKIELLPSSQSPAKPATHPKNGRCVSIKRNGSIANTAERLSNVKNSTITMKPIEKKRDGTLIDYGATVTTRKKLERKLSGSRSTSGGVQRKKITRQEEPVVVATIKEVIPKRNRDVRGDAINRNIGDPRSKQNGTSHKTLSTTSENHILFTGPDKNRRRTCETRDHCRPLQKKWNKLPSKATTNDPNESRAPRTSVHTEKRNSKASESQVVETVTPDKKLLYSIWLRRFKERTGQDPDPTKDPTSRDS